MSAAAETLLALAIYNSWRRGDETIEMPAPAEIGATIDDAVNLLRKYDDLKARAERAEAELKEWSLLNLWGGTPEIIHAFIKGQQNRICAAQDADAELATERETSRLLKVAMDVRDEGYTQSRRRMSALESELAGIRALADRRNKRYHVEDTTHQLVAALDQALDIAQAELAAEREKVRVLRSACESIEEQWDKNHSANPFHAGNVMQSHAMRALAATEDAT